MALNPTLRSYKRDLKFGNDFGVTSRGDLEQVTGLDNIRQAVFQRLITSPGSIAHRPGYGVGIKNYQNSPMTIATQQEIMLAMQKQFVDDDRIEELEELSITQNRDNPGQVEIKLKVRPRGYDALDIVMIPFDEVT